jgi:hypothetical protein
MQIPIVRKKTSRRQWFNPDGYVNKLVEKVFNQAMTACGKKVKVGGVYSVILAVQHSHDHSGPFDWDMAEWYITKHGIKPNELNNCDLWNKIVAVRNVTVYQEGRTNPTHVEVAKLEYKFNQGK